MVRPYRIHALNTQLFFIFYCKSFAIVSPRNHAYMSFVNGGTAGVECGHFVLWVCERPSVLRVNVAQDLSYALSSGHPRNTSNKLGCRSRKCF